MSTRSNYALRLPASLKAEAERIAEQEGTTLNQLINMAVAEKISALKTADYLAERGAKGDARRALRLLRKAGRKGAVAKGDDIDG